MPKVLGNGGDGLLLILTPGAQTGPLKGLRCQALPLERKGSGKGGRKGGGPPLPKTQIESSTDAHQFGLLGFWTPSMDHVSPKQSSQWFQQSPPVNPRGALSAPGLLPQSSPHTMAQAAPPSGPAPSQTSFDFSPASCHLCAHQPES